MTRRIWAVGVLLMGLALVSCTDSPSGSDAQASPSSSQAQEVVDAAVEKLYASPSVDVALSRLIDYGADSPVPTHLEALWFPSDDAWTGVGSGPNPSQASAGRLFTQYLYVDGRLYVRQSLSRDFPGNWITTKDPEDSSRQPSWSLSDPLTEFRATRAVDEGGTTTVYGVIPNETAIKAFSLSFAVEDEGYSDEMYQGETLALLTVKDGYPASLEIFGDDVEIPTQEVPDYLLQMIAGSEATYRYAEGTATTPLEPPPPSEVDRVSPDFSTDG